ncbi:hypothetical protein [Streptomyces sp. NPDC087525]|uniref:hypothetical protein n=1 Tax=Streptomyces sp. NPDC087525 TaxID=3365793 RepID=UPI003830E0E9
MAVRKDQPGETDSPEQEEARSPNGTSSQQAKDTGDAHAGPHAIAISGNVHYTEGPSEELILTLLHALDSLKPDAPPKPAGPSRKTVPSPPADVLTGEHDDASRPCPVALDGNAREPRRLRGLLRASRVTRLPATLLAVLLVVAIVVAIAVVVRTHSSSGPDDQRAAKRPAEHTGGPSASQSRSASAAPTRTPSRTPPRAPDDPDDPDDPGGTTATPAPRPSPSPKASSGNPAPGPPPPPRPQRPPEETASEPTTPDQVPGRIFIVRGHGNEMNVNLTGFAPDEDVTIYAYTDTDATNGPYDQRTHTIDADGTREFGAFPMGASGDYWVVARGVTSNVLPWTGR